MGRSGYFFLILGPSGGGKSTIIKNVLKNLPNVEYYPSYTTRSPRTGEVNGIDYCFVSEIRFKKLINDELLLEWDQPHKTYYYGIPKQPALIKLKNGISLVREIGVNGLDQMTKSVASSFIYSIFIRPDKPLALKERLIKRGELHIEKRLAMYESELKRAGNCSLVLEAVEGYPEICSRKVIDVINSLIKNDK